MREKEQRLWDRMSRNAPSHLVFLQRVEDMLGAGIPDVFAKHKHGRYLIPIELKAVDDFPARATTRVFGDEGLAQSQKNWLMEFSRFKGHALILCSVGRDARVYHWAIPGFFHDEFNNMTREELDVRALFHGRGADFWDALWAFLGENGDIVK